MCTEPIDTPNRRHFATYLKNGKYNNGSYPEGSRAYFKCELVGSRILYHPSVCLANGKWTQTSRCEGSRFTGSKQELGKVNGNNVFNMY